MRVPDDSVELLAGYIYGLFVLSFSLLILYGAGAAEDPQNFSKFILYALIMIFPLVGRTIIVWLQDRNVFEKIESLRGFQYFSFHSPEQTPLGRSFPEVMRGKVLLPISVIVALFFGLFVSVNASFSTGTPELVTGSISPGTELALAVEPAVFAETLLFNVAIPFGLIGVFYYFLFTRGVSHRFSYALSHVLSWPVSSLIFLAYHFFRYSGSEYSLANILVQGLIYNGATLSTHSIIPAYSLHASGNFFSKASKGEIFTSDFALLVVIGGVLLAAIPLIVYFFREMG